VNQLIGEQFPGTEVVGSNYPPSAANVAASKVVSFATMGCVGATFFGEKIFEMIGMARPELVVSMQANKMGTTMGAWFVGNMVSQNLLNTGAFEIYYDGEVIFSKLQTSRLPNVPEVMTNLESAIKARQESNASLGAGAGGAVEPEALEAGAYTRPLFSST
jgi:selT/selW/selH-like putative selenoprotein